MIFNSLTYLLLLAVVVLLYWLLPYKARLWMIFLSSLTFYAFWRVDFLPILLASVAVDYFVAKAMPEKIRQKRRWLLYCSLVTNLGLLFYFKYLIFFADSAIGLVNAFGGEIDPFFLNIVLPLGISFYTFQTISYTVDVYRGFIKPEQDFVLYGCYVTFFPQLVAGPVLRAAEVIPQFARRPNYEFEHIITGCRRILAGLFLKVVLADNIAPLVDQGFETPVAEMSALDVWTLAFLFGFQIYFDFSAYSHIALGSARMMGIRFPENFNFPYLAISPRDFWKRWHISLSSWIRDYLYLPLAGIAVQDRSIGGLEKAALERGHTKALFFTWAIMGLWHGANWTFLVWGLYHALVIVLFRRFSGRTRGEGRLSGGWGVVLTLPVMMLGWVPFRAESVMATFAMWSKVLEPASYGWLGLRENTYLVAALLLISVTIAYWTKTTLIPWVREKRPVMLVFDTLGSALMIGLVFVFLRPINQFIYFQF